MSDTTLIQRLQAQYGHPFTANGESRIDYSRHPLVGKAIAALEQQARELNDAINEFTAANAEVEQQAAQIAEKDAEIARLRMLTCKCVENSADATRYRLLRRGQQWSVIDGIGDTLRADALDARIDAALRQEQPT